MNDVGILEAWELYAHWLIYAPVKFTACPKIYLVCPKALSKNKTKKSEIVCEVVFVSGWFGRRLLFH